eukprot:1122453-Rhodomonas_salina.1
MEEAQANRIRGRVARGLKLYVCVRLRSVSKHTHVLSDAGDGVLHFFCRVFQLAWGPPTPSPLSVPSIAYYWHRIHRIAQHSILEHSLA